MTTEEKLEFLKAEIAGHLGQIDGTLEEWGLDLRCLTLIARDPDDDESVVVVSNDDEAEAFEVARKHIPTD